MKEAVEHAAEAVAIKIGNAAQVGGASVGLWAFVTSNEGVAVIGIIAAIGGLAVSWYFARQRNTRERIAAELKETRDSARHILEMKLLNEKYATAVEEHERSIRGEGVK